MSAGPSKSVKFSSDAGGSGGGGGSQDPSKPSKSKKSSTSSTGLRRKKKDKKDKSSSSSNKFKFQLPPMLQPLENIQPDPRKKTKDEDFSNIPSFCCFQINNRAFFLDAKKISREQITNTVNQNVLGTGAAGTVNEITIRSTTDNQSQCGSGQLNGSFGPKTPNNMSPMSMSSGLTMSMGNGQISHSVSMPNYDNNNNNPAAGDASISNPTSPTPTGTMSPNEIEMKFAVKRILIGGDAKKNRYTKKDNEISRLTTERGCEYMVKYYGTMLYEQEIWIVMERMDSSLHNFNRSFKRLGYADRNKEKPLPVPYCFLRKLTFCLIEGLFFLKETLQVIHRDIKPSNILISLQNCSIKICDFGIAGDVNNSKKTMGIGSCPYMAPERLKSNDLSNSTFRSEAGSLSGSSRALSGSSFNNYSDRADVWSVGMTLIETMQGEYPYGHAARNGPPVALTAIIVSDDKHPEIFPEVIEWYCKPKSSRTSSEDEHGNTNRDGNSNELNSNLSKRTSNNNSNASSTCSSLQRSDSERILAVVSEKLSNCMNLDSRTSPNHLQEIHAPRPIKTNSLPIDPEAELQERFDETKCKEDLIDFCRKCVIKAHVKDPRYPDLAIRPDYDELKRHNFYKDIVKNRWNEVELQYFFEKTFEELPKYMKEKKERPRIERNF